MALRKPSVCPLSEGGRSVASLSPAPVGGSISRDDRERALWTRWSLCVTGRRRGKGVGGFKRTGVIAADEEVVFVVMAAFEDTGLEVVAAWWGDVRVDGCGCGISRGESEGER